MLRNPKARITANLTIASYLALLVALVITTFYPEQIEGVSVPLMLTVKLLPLVALAVPVFRGNNRGYIWLSFVVIFYFTRFLVSAWLTQGAAAPVILTLLTLLLFISAMVHLKVNRALPIQP